MIRITLTAHALNDQYCNSFILQIFRSIYPSPEAMKFSHGNSL